MPTEKSKNLTLDDMQLVLTEWDINPQKVLPKTSLMHELRLGLDDFPLILCFIEDVLEVELSIDKMSLAIESCYRERMTVEDFIACYNRHFVEN